MFKMATSVKQEIKDLIEKRPGPCSIRIHVDNVTPNEEAVFMIEFVDGNGHIITYDGPFEIPIGSNLTLVKWQRGFEIHMTGV